MKLRPLRKSDIAALAAWLPSTAAAAGCERWADPEALTTAITTEGVLVADEGGAVGLVSYEAAGPGRAEARILLLAVDPERRRLGFGGRAALALERRLRPSADQVCALVPARLGLALYFWLRLGYRPLTHAERPPPAQARPSLWMVRSLR